jgi:NAD(P)-dependent dehydrogenase (short-subunit alcohol dehydrogenase family)
VASKGGILSLTRAMVLELCPYRITVVNAKAPGSQPSLANGGSEAERIEMARSIPLGHMAQLDEIAQGAAIWREPR